MGNIVSATMFRWLMYYTNLEINWQVFLVPQIYNANRFKVDMSKFPLISAITERLSELEAFKNAHPESQPDAVK